ncbi:MAG: hypothetical protein KDK56_02460 [Simkania sp.]|nr:hypothetical protein [Simkania sp.]MCB1075814.1 hypothetical protein [Simkania sp.]MCP5489518.1 hypothetical protein [Chlamydiales bacterium]
MTYLNPRDEHVENALRVSRTSALPEDHIRRCYDWNIDHMGYEWNALFDYNSPNVLETEKVIAWNHTRKRFTVLSMEDVMALFHDRTNLKGIKHTFTCNVKRIITTSRVFTR